LEREGARVVFGWMTQPIPSIEAFDRPAALLQALGVERSSLPVELYDLGPRHVFVSLQTPDEVAGLRPDMRALADLGDFGFNAFACHGDRVKTRMFAPAHGVDEDAATGSAAGPLATHLVRHGVARPGQEITIEQGAEIGRPSRLHACVYGSPQAIERVEVGGSAVVVGHGELRLRGL
jgi:trans-2,3-dihydro-3-hydroxyanthranilate isomerase